MWSAAALLPLLVATHKPLLLLSLSKLKQLVQKAYEP
jgi:hypothetical protein